MLLGASCVAFLMRLGRFFGFLGAFWRPQAPRDLDFGRFCTMPGWVFSVPLHFMLALTYLHKTRAGIHFPLFVSTLQRGGTCAAHGIGAKLAQNHKFDKG